MNTRSCKAKGRRLQNKIVEELRMLLRRKNVQEPQVVKSIYPAIMGESGVDIKFGYLADINIGEYSIECKNQENWNVLKWWEQTVANTIEGRTPILVIGKNRTEPLVVMRFEDWLKTL